MSQDTPRCVTCGGHLMGYISGSCPHCTGAAVLVQTESREMLEWRRLFECEAPGCKGSPPCRDCGEGRF